MRIEPAPRARGSRRRGEAHLQAAEFGARGRLILGDRNVLGERVEPDVERERIAVLVDGPLAAQRARGVRQFMWVRVREGKREGVTRRRASDGAQFGGVRVPGADVFCLQMLEL
mgnify:CR=1 FL=1